MKLFLVGFVKCLSYYCVIMTLIALFILTVEMIDRQPWIGVSMSIIALGCIGGFIYWYLEHNK